MEKTKTISCIHTAIKDGIIKGKFLQERKVFEFPPVDNIDAKNNKSTWVISVYARDKESNEDIPIENEWITCPIIQQPKHVIGVIQTVIRRHTGHLQVNDETIIEKGKNIGKLNASTPISQAFSEAYRKYTNKVKNASNKTKNMDIRPFPMLVKKSGITKAATLIEEDFKDGVVVQPKLDGIRTIAHMLSDNTIEFYSRKALSFSGLDHIAKEICEILSKYNGDRTDIYLDGEIYIHNTPLQEISGAIRGENNELKSSLEFHIFDLFLPNYMGMTQRNRFELLHKVIKKNYKYVKLVPTELVKSREELNEIYNKYIDNDNDHYEGAIARRLSGVYKPGIGGQRSNDVIKIKPFSTDEYEIVDYKDGRGRDKGAISFILKTNKGEEFSAVPNMTIEARKELFSSFKKNKKEFDKKYRGKEATIQYADLSKKGIPTQPKWITLRNYE